MTVGFYDLGRTCKSLKYANVLVEEPRCYALILGRIKPWVQRLEKQKEQ